MGKELKTRSVNTIVVDENTGEMIQTVNQEVGVFEKEPPYVKLYLEDIGKLNGLNPTENKLVHELVYNMGYNNVVPAYKPVKEIIAKRIGVSYNTLNEAIKSMHRKGVLIRKARGMYIMDPSLFGRGSWSDIKKIRMTIEYGEDGRKQINTEISKQLGLWDE